MLASVGGARSPEWHLLLVTVGTLIYWPDVARTRSPDQTPVWRPIQPISRGLVPVGNAAHGVGAQGVVAMPVALPLGQVARCHRQVPHRQTCRRRWCQPAVLGLRRCRLSPRRTSGQCPGRGRGGVRHRPGADGKLWSHWPRSIVRAGQSRARWRSWLEGSWFSFPSVGSRRWHRAGPTGRRGRLGRLVARRSNPCLDLSALSLGSAAGRRTWHRVGPNDRCRRRPGGHWSPASVSAVSHTQV